VHSQFSFTASTPIRRMFSFLVLFPAIFSSARLRALASCQTCGNSHPSPQESPHADVSPLPSLFRWPVPSPHIFLFDWKTCPPSSAFFFPAAQFLPPDRRSLLFHHNSGVVLFCIFGFPFSPFSKIEATTVSLLLVLTLCGFSHSEDCNAGVFLTSGFPPCCLGHRRPCPMSGGLHAVSCLGFQFCHLSGEEGWRSPPTPLGVDCFPGCCPLPSHVFLVVFSSLAFRYLYFMQGGEPNL